MYVDDRLVATMNEEGTGKICEWPLVLTMVDLY
jgi:hypothetical protein